MAKDMKKDIKKESKTKKASGYGRDRERFDRSARIMAIVMVILMIAFTFLTAGIFMLG